MFKKIFSQLNNWILLLVAAMLAMPTLAIADAITTTTGADAKAVFDMQTVYREQIIASMATVFFNNAVFSWQGGLTKSLLAICVIVSMFQIIAKYWGTNAFLVEWAKWAVAMMFALMVLGGVDSSKVFPYTPVLSNGQAVEGPATLDKAVFFWLSGEFNSIAGAFQTYGGPSEFSYAMNQLLDNLQEFELTLRYCGPTDQSCYMKAFNYIKTAPAGSADALAKQKSAPGQVLLTKNTSQTASDSTATATPGTGFGAMVTLMENFFNGIADIVMQIIPIPFLLIKIMIFLLDYLRMFLNYFTLISYALISGVSLLFAKLFTVFIVMPNQRPRIIQAYKVPLSSTMYGFLTAFITAVATVIIQSVNKATIATIIQASSANGIDTSGVVAVLFGDSMSICAMLMIQIMAMSKIPGFARKLWDLSFDEIIDFGKAVIEAGFGVLKMAGGVGLAGAAAVTGGLAAGVASAAGGVASAASGAASAIGGGGSVAGAAGGFLKGSASSLLTGAKAGAQATGRSLLSNSGHSPSQGLAGFLGMDDSGGGKQKDSGTSRVTGDVKATLDDKGSHGGGGMGINSKSSKDKKNDDDDSSGGGSSGGSSTGEVQSSVPRDKVVQAEAANRSQNQRNLAQKYTASSFGDRVSAGVKSVGGLIGGLAAAGVDQASGKGFDLKRHVSGQGAANLAFGAAGVVADHANYYSEYRGQRQQAKAASAAAGDQRATEFHDLAANSSPEKVDAHELHALSNTINSGNGTNEEIAKYNQMVDYADLEQLPTEIRTSAKAARDHESVTKWKEDKNARLSKLMKSKNLNNYESKDSQELHQMMKGGEIVGSDFTKHEGLRDFQKQNRLDVQAKTDSALMEAKEKFEHGRTKANLAILTKIEKMQASQAKKFASEPNSKRFEDNVRKQVEEYKQLMPDLKASEIAATFNISEAHAKEYLEKAKSSPVSDVPGVDEDDGPKNPAGV